MDKKAKELYEIMIDYRRYGVLLLATGVFFYLGVIIPSIAKEMQDIYIMMGTSTLFLSGSILSFLRALRARKELQEMDEGSEYLFKK